MNLKLKIALLFVMLLNISVFAQEEYILKGIVTSQADNTTLPGVTFRVLNTDKGGSTDFDGNFEIKVQKGDVLEFSYLGFVKQSVSIKDQQNLTISMVEDTTNLDEIVVVGYGTQKKSHLTGAISKVTNESLDQIAVSRVDDALIGQVSGVNIQSTEGEAGSAPTIRIRGVGSISGNVNPLIVVDGLVVDNDFLGSLDMNDVASFEVLKDAASTAIYGSRGSKGVIMITTKEGKQGKTKFSYNTYTGVKKARQSDSYYFTVAETVAKEMAANGVLSDITKYKQLLGVDNNWQNIIFDGGNIVSHSFAVRGGSKQTKFSTALNYIHDEGVLLTDDYKKYSIRLKIDTKVNDKFSFGANLSPSYTNRRRFDGSTHDILRQPSWLPMYLDENTIKFVNRTRDGGKYANAKVGDYAIQRMFDDYDLAAGAPSTGSGTDISNTSNTNPAAKVLERERRDKKFKVFGNVYAKYAFTDDLSLKTSFGGDFQNTEYSRWQGVLSNRNGASAAKLDLASTNRIHLVSESVLSFTKEFGNHEFFAILGTGAESWNTNYSASFGAGYSSDVLQTISAADPLTVTAASEAYENRLLSFFTRVNYAYNDTYLASVSVRRDGASVFGANNKFGNFPAVSVGWNVHNEEFLQESEVLTNLKFRVSYGITGNPGIDTGNNQIDNYPYLSLIGTTNAVFEGNSTAIGFNPLNIANPDLKWERSIEINPGIDFGLFNNVISGSLDYYKRTSDQLLIDNPVSVATGFSSALVNIGEVENTGLEFELRSRNISKENFKWSSTFIASRNKNTLINFADSNGQIQSVDAKRAAEWINSEGNPISSFYGWVVDKDIPAEYLNNPFHPIGAEAQDVYVKDLNGDGLIDNDDKAILGSPYPDFVWSLSNEFKIGNVDVSFMFQGSHGAEVRNMGDQYIFNHFNSGQDFNPATTPNQEFIKQKIFTNDIVQDASYIALRNVNIGYNFSNYIVSKLGFSKGRLYVSGQNLMYLTAAGYTGFNPESINDTSSTTYGYQRAGSPVFSTVSLGLNIEF
mgnify:FL=1